MKKILIAIMCLAFISVNAQDKKWHMHAGAGLILSKASSQAESKAKVGVSAWFMEQYRVNDYIALEAGLQYTYAPTEFEVLESITHDQVVVSVYEINYHRLSIPLLVRAFVMPTERDGLNFFVGPQIDFSLGANGKFNGIGYGFSEYTKSVAFSGVAGVGYDFKNGLTLSLSQTFGLSGINKKGYMDLNSVSKLRYTALKIGWKF